MPAGERQRLLGVAVVARRVHPVRHVVADHAVLDSFLVILVEVLEHDLANGLDGFAPVLGQFGEVLFNGGRFALHGRIAWLKGC